VSQQVIIPVGPPFDC